MILIDNTVLSNFALADELFLLKTFCETQGATTIEVFTEFDSGVEQGIFKPFKFDWIKLVKLETGQEKILFSNLRKRFGAGESSCLAIAIQRKYDFLTDDMAVRKIAIREGIRISGSIGVLLELIRAKEIALERGNNILTNFISKGYFSPVDTLSDLIIN